MDTTQDPSHTIAFCYLQESGNEQHKIWLSREHLQLYYKGKHRVFELRQIRSLAFNHRKLMLPLVTGGITATLSLVAIFKVYYNPWLMLSLLIGGLLTAYLGYQGSWVLTVDETKYQHDFFLKTISPNLRAFLNYANTFTDNLRPGLLYLPLSQQKWEEEKHSEKLLLQTKQRLFFHQEISNIDPQLSVLLPLSSLDEEINIHWEPDEQGVPHPFLPAGSLVPLQKSSPYFRQPTT